MSKAPFEGFLAKLFCDYIAGSTSLDTKYQFTSSNPEQSIQLYNGFKSLKFKSISINDAFLNYVEAANNTKIIVMLHHLGTQDNESNHEDFIASIRDALNDIENAILFVINNSSLETLTSTFTNVNKNGSVFTPSYVNKALSALCSGHADESIFQYLITKAEEKIVEENLSIFGYESLYNSMHQDRIDLTEHGLFAEPKLSDINDDKLLKRELDRNFRLSKTIEARVNDFFDEPNELLRQLEDVGLSERYIKENFLGGNRGKYKDKSFSELENEIEKNKVRNLELVDIEINGEKAELWKRHSETGASSKNISLVSELSASPTIEIKIKFTRGEPLLKSDQVTTYGDLKQNQIIKGASNHEAHSILNIRIPFSGKPLFFQIRLKRPSQRESFEFNFCFVGQNTFFLEKFFEKLEVDVTRNKGKLILENLTGKIELNPEGLNQVNIIDVEDTIDFENLRLIDFGKPEDDEVMGDFKFSFGEHSLPISIAGSKVIESVKLPSIFDSQRGREIFDDERIPLFKPLSSSPRVVISGREKELSVQARELCLLEYKYLSKDIVYLNEKSGKELSLDEIGPIFPNIYTAYKDLFLWLRNNNTILSISNWTLELIGLVDSLLQSIRAELESIPQESLSPNSRKLLEIGMYENETGEYFTPFHPISLSYALEFAKLRLGDETNSFDKIPPTTIDKLNAGGLLPILFDEKSGYVKTQPLAHNRLWLEIVPQKKSGCSYIPTLVHEKIHDFLTCFDMLFKQSKESPLIINSINNQSNMEVFKGILNYYKKAKGKARKIQVNIYDDKYHYTAFDKFSETRSIVELRDLVRTGGTDKEAVLDELIFLLRKNVSLHKKTRADEFDYAHLCFFKNNEEVTLRANNVKQGKSGVVCDGILSGEASYLENDVFYTGFGLKNVDKDSTSVELASLYNQLLLPYRDKSAKFVKDSVPVLAVKDTFKEKLEKSYDSSIWTCIIEPKVTLEFFDTKETILIHYADQYTNSVAYDAITVSSRVGLYKDLLRSESDELINSFNALNGQWLLSIVKEVGKKKTKNTEKQIREKQGIVAAYKFISSILLPSDITWVPLSVGEMLRVTGNLGLEIKDSDFAARLHEKSKGALSDDILFVGINNEQLVLLPLEVKSRKVGTDFTKAVEQAKALSDHMKRILVPQTLKGKIYRSLFIQQILTQIDKFELYEVFPKAYFESLRKGSDSLLQGNYQISDLVNYPEGVVLAVNEGMERSKIDIKHDEEANILKVRLPQAFVKMLHEEPILALSEKFKDKTMFPELEDLTLHKAEFCKFNITENTETTSIASEEEASEDTMEEVEISPQEKPNGFEAKFEYPDQFIELVEKLISVYGRDIDSSDVLETKENELSNDNQFTSSDLLQFYRLKDFLNAGEESSGLLKDTALQNKADDNSIKLRNINVSSNYKALVNTILTHFNEDILVEDVLNISIPELKKIKGFGNGKITKFLDLIELLKNNGFSQNIEQESKQINDFDLPLDSLEEYLLDDLEEYFSEENNRQVDVLARRLGIGCESETLEEIGQSYKITRERIRQIEKRSKKDFISSLSISPKVIWAVTKTNLSELRSPLFPRLRRKFSSNKNFYSFLEVCCNLSENQIKQVTSPNLRKTVVEEFWTWNKSPSALEDLAWYIHENANVELAVAENQIAIWIAEGLLEKDEDLIKPKSLSKTVGISNALLDFPNGESWKTIQMHANTKNSVSSQYFVDRLDPSLMHSVDKEYIYQCDRGSYRHLAYASFGERDTEIILSRVNSKLNEYRHQGRDSVNLHSDIYIPVGFSEDYFVVRHIVRAFGETIGVYFNGKSGADTVSLNSEFNLASQKSVLIDFFKRSLSPISKKEVASKIRSQSLGHASFYLDKLLTDGDIVRIDESHYAHVANAFEDVDIKGTLSLAFDYIEREERIIEGEKIQSHLNKHLDDDRHKYFYISLLKTHAKHYGKKYYFVQNLISKEEIKYSGLSDICRSVLRQSSSIEQAFSLVDDKLCIHRHVVKRCFDQLSYEKIQDSKKADSTFDESGHEINSEILANDEKAQNDEVQTLLSEFNAKPPKLEFSRILIGQQVNTNDSVYWEYGNKNLANRHLIIFGGSGNGKTYCIQGLLMELAKHKLNSMVIDYTNGFRDEHLEPEYTDFVQPQTNLLVHKPIELNPFERQKQKIAGVEIYDKAHDVASRVASVFNSVYSDIGSQQLPTLIRTIEEGIKSFGEGYNFDKLLEDLIESGKHGEALANKLYPLAKANLFSFSQNADGWKGVYKSPKPTTRIIQMATLSRDIWLLATEFILWDLYSYSCANGDKNTPLPVILDEVQNLDQKLDSPLGKMLTEGRKYGLSLILATQTLSNLKKDEQDRLFQAAHKLFFAPANTEVHSYAKLLELAVPGTTKKGWLEELANLKKGECISVGLHLNKHGVPEQSAKVVKVSSLSSRLT